MDKRSDSVRRKKRKKSMGEKMEEKVDLFDLIATLGEVLLLIPRAIWRFIQ